MDSRFADLTQIFTRTPMWVWLLFLALVFLGVRRGRPRVLPLRRVAILPAVFLLWGLTALSAAIAVQPAVLLAWLAAALAGVGLGWIAAPVSGLRADRDHRLVYLPGTWTVLAVSLMVFALKYAINVTLAIRPDLRPVIAYWDMAVSGGSAGFFVASLTRTLLSYRRAESVDLGESAPLR